MSVAGDAPDQRPKLADGTGAVLIALVYLMLGPIVGLVLVVPIAAVAAAEFSEQTLPAALFAVVATLPISVPLAYAFAGTLALATGAIVGAVAHRRGRVPVRIAVTAPTAVVLGFAALYRFVHVEIPGTAVLRGDGQIGMLIWVFVSIAASLVCWLVTRPIQRRMR